MKQKKALVKIQDLLKKPSFTTEEAEKHGVSRHTLAYYAKTGEITRLGPGIYYNPKNQILDDWKWEDLARVVTAVPSGVVCSVSALDIYGLTEEIPRQLWIAIPHRLRALRIPGTHFVRMRNMELGRTTIMLGEIEIAIFDKERTVVDAFHHLGFEIAFKALKKMAAKESLNFKKLSEYSRILRIDITSYIMAVST